jgi:hypothetical protein
VGGIIVYQFSVDDFADLFDSRLNLDVRYPLADVRRLQPNTIDLFEYDLNIGLWRRLRANSFPPPLLSTTLSGKAMLGIGGIPTASAILERLQWRVPPGAFPPWILFAAALLTLPMWIALKLGAGRRRQLAPAALGVALVLCSAGVVFSTPAVTGNPPVAVNNARFMSVKNQFIPLPGNRIGPGKCATYEVETYQGKGDPKDAANWEKAPLTEYFPDSFETKTFGVKGVTSQKVTFPTS